MTTPIKRIKEIEKGCGKPFSSKSCFGACRRNDLCPTCQAKLQQHNEILPYPKGRVS